jgi:hypothetical protein
MRDVRIDRRPRILDFTTKINDVRATRNLAWPCHAFRVTIPVRPTSRLNIFEQTVLRLLDEARLDASALADTTCLDVSLVKLVCCRLRDLGLITEHHELTPLGSSQLSLTDNEPFDYEVRIIFRERISGALLPIVLGGELKYEEIASWNEKNCSVEIRKANDSSVHLRMLSSPVVDGSPRPPTVANVLWATNRHRELSRQYAALRLGGAPYPHVVHAQQMNVDPHPESVFLRCRVVVPSAGDDYRIGDPFGYGFSDLLFRAYEGLRAGDPDEQAFTRKLRDSASTVRPRSPTADTKAEETAVLSRLAGAVTEYPDLFAKLRQAEKELHRCKKNPTSSDAEAHFAYHGQQTAQSLCEALEATLAHISARSRRAACETTLGGHGQTPQANAQLLEQLAERLGLRARGVGGLFRVPPGRVRALRDGAVDLQALLAVALASASEDPEHPLRRIAASFDNWLSFLREIKTMRDAGAHGQSWATGSTRLKALLEGTYRSIELLLPGLARDVPTASPTSAASTVETAHDTRRRAISRLEDHFGVQWYVGLGTDVAELLTQVELATPALAPQVAGPLNVVRMINDLASVLQALAHARQAPAPQALGSGETHRAKARLRAVESGLLNEGAELPPCLATVNPRRLDEAMQGRSPSLGASLMALLIVAPLEWLKALALASPGFLDLCARVIDLRGHGNRPVFLQAEDVLMLKDRVYAACAALMEG